MIFFHIIEWACQVLFTLTARQSSKKVELKLTVAPQGQKTSWNVNVNKSTTLVTISSGSDFDLEELLPHILTDIVAQNVLATSLFLPIRMMFQNFYRSFGNKLTFSDLFIHIDDDRRAAIFNMFESISDQTFRGSIIETILRQTRLVVSETMTIWDVVGLFNGRSTGFFDIDRRAVRVVLGGHFLEPFAMATITGVEKAIKNGHVQVFELMRIVNEFRLLNVDIGEL